eukprot:1333686-Alexandrium_andersonii.AAC.1
MRVLSDVRHLDRHTAYCRAPRVSSGGSNSARPPFPRPPLAGALGVVAACFVAAAASGRLDSAESGDSDLWEGGERFEAV